MRDRFRAGVAILLGAAALQMAWLLVHPEPEPLLRSDVAREAGPVSLAPIEQLYEAGKGADAIASLARLVREAPAVADKGGALTTSPALRALVLTGWKQAVSSAGDREASLTRDVRFLQRRLAGGCS